MPYLWKHIPCPALKIEYVRCAPCNTLGDERHYIYDCPEIERNDIEDIPDLQDLANYNKLQLLFRQISLAHKCTGSM